MLKITFLGGYFVLQIAFPQWNIHLNFLNKIDPKCSKNEENIQKAGVELPISRLVVNQPSSTSAGGSLTNGFAPTTTLGCGSWGGNSISENLDYKHLMNVSRIGKVIPDKKVPTDDEIWA